MEAILILTILRFLVPLLIFKWPILGMFAAMYLDLQDYNYFNIRTAEDLEFYQTWDKILDTYYLAIAFIVSLSWQEKFAKKLSIIFFSWRLAGVVLLMFVADRTILLAFPNFFENFFLFYIIFKKFTDNAKLFTSMPITIIILASIFIPKFFAEYYLHVLDSPQLFDLDRTVITLAFPTSLEGIVIYSMYIGPTLAVLLGRIIYVRKNYLC